LLAQSEFGNVSSINYKGHCNHILWSRS